MNTNVAKLKVFVGLSGGVDSAVAAYLLEQQGYAVTGVFMKNWSDPLADECPWEREAADARRVCQTLGIPFRIATFEDEYRDRVVDYLIKGYRQGITPNPDVLCNREIKFKVFLEYALAHGADYIATGHYVRRVEKKIGNRTQFELHKATDKNKDQSYFLALLTQAQLRRALFPLGRLTKPEVRRIAKKAGLHVSEKKDSQGICFIGKVKFSDFIREFIPPAPGRIIDTKGNVIGRHDGVAYYTIGQRHGLHIGGGVPYYVVKKNKRTKTVVVARGHRHPALYHQQLQVRHMHWIGDSPKGSFRAKARIRYRQPLQTCAVRGGINHYQLTFTQRQRAITLGQFVVLYRGTRMLGGGAITSYE